MGVGRAHVEVTNVGSVVRCPLCCNRLFDSSVGDGPVTVWLASWQLRTCGALGLRNEMMSAWYRDSVVSRGQGSRWIARSKS